MNAFNKNNIDYDVFRQIRRDIHDLKLDTLSNDERQKALQEIADRVVGEFTKPYLESCMPMGYKYNSPEIEIADMGKNVAGQAYPDKIKLNSNIVFENPDTTFSTLVHEAIHYGQRALGKTMLLKPTQETELMRASVRSVAPPRETFGIITQGQVYVASNSRNMSEHGDAELRSALYHFNFTERQAYNTVLDISRRCGVDFFADTIMMDLRLNEIRERYSCHHMSDEQIYDMIDKAQLNIAKERVPSNPREASLTYDVAALIYEQTRSSNQRVQSMRDAFFAQMMEPERKAEVLAQNGFYNCHTISFEQAKEYTLDDIKGLSQAERDQNPILMTLGVYKYGEEVAQLINKDTYNQWCFSEDNMMPKEMLEKVVEIMGQEYEPILIGNDEIDMDWLFLDDTIDRGVEVAINLDRLTVENIDSLIQNMFAGEINMPEVLDFKEPSIEEIGIERS